MKLKSVAAALALCAWTSHADLFKFYAITSNDPSGYAQLVGETQFLMDATLLGLGKVQLVFSNTGPAEAVVTRIYFDTFPELDLEVVSISNGAGVDFQVGATSPANLPAGYSMNDAFESDLGLSALNPTPKNGINPGESLGVVLAYDTGYDFLGGLGNEEVRVGLHVQSFEGGYSESFVNAIPEPTTLPMMLIGSTALRWLRIKRTKRGKKSGDAFAPCLPESGKNGLEWVETKAPRSYSRKPRNRLEAAFAKVVS